MKPADCKSLKDTTNLKEVGVKVNNNEIMVAPSTVILTMGHTTIKIPQSTFRTFAEWYLEDQK